MNKDGHFLSEERKKAFQQLAVPTNMTQLRSFLGTANYFRSYIKDFGNLTKPLIQLLTPGKQVRVELGPDDVLAFERIKEAIASTAVAYFPLPEGVFKLYTDASDVACGGHLVQEHEGVEYTLCFTSHIFSKAQLSWSTCDKEMYGIISAVRRLHHYLADRYFLVLTDHRNLSFRTNRSQRVQRWKAELQEYQFDILPIAGVKNCVADTLSRLVSSGSSSEELDEPEDISLEEFLTSPSTDEVEDEEGDWGIELSYLDAVIEEDTDQFHQLVTDTDWDVKAVLSRFHNEQTLHPSAKVTVEKLQAAGYSWPGMITSVRDYINSCPHCQKIKDKYARFHGEPFSVMAEEVMHIVAADTLGPLRAKDEIGHEYIMVLIDMFSRHAELVPLRTVTADETCEALYDFFTRFGRPRILQTDSGSQFRNAKVTGLLEELGIEHKQTMAGSHQENSIVENRMRSLRRMMGPKVPKSLFKFCGQAREEMNSRKHATIGVCPADLMFGYQHRLGGVTAKVPERSLEDAWIDTALEVGKTHKAKVESALTTQKSFQREGVPRINGKEESHSPKGTQLDENSKVTKSEPEMTDNNPPKRIRANPIEEGSWILVEEEGALKTGAERRQGPYRVLRVDASRVIFESPKFPGRERAVHISRCTKYQGRDGEDPHEESLRGDSRYHVVRRVLDHKSSGRRPSMSNTKVLIEWAADGSTTWEPLRGATVRRLAAVQDYVALHPELQHLHL